MVSPTYAPDGPSSAGEPLASPGWHLTGAGPSADDSLSQPEPAQPGPELPATSWLLST